MRSPGSVVLFHTSPSTEIGCDFHSSGSTTLLSPPCFTIRQTFYFALSAAFGCQSIHSILSHQLIVSLHRFDICHLCNQAQMTHRDEFNLHFDDQCVCVCQDLAWRPRCCWWLDIPTAKAWPSPSWCWRWASVDLLYQVSVYTFIFILFYIFLSVHPCVGSSRIMP